MKPLLLKSASFSLAFALVFKTSLLTYASTEKTTPIDRKTTFPESIKQMVDAQTSILGVLPAKFVQGLTQGSNLSADVLSSVVSFWHSLFNHATSTTVIITSTSTPTTTQETFTFPSTPTTPPSTYTPPSNPTVIYEPSSSTGVTEAELNSKLTSLQSYLLSQISSIHPGNSTTTIYQSSGGGGNTGTAVYFSAPGYIPAGNANPSVTTLTASGNITASAFYGDGSHLTGINGSFSTSTLDTDLNELAPVVLGFNNATSTSGYLSSTVGVCNNSCGTYTSTFGYYNTNSGYASSAFGNNNTV